MSDDVERVAWALKAKAAEIDHRPDIHVADPMWFSDEYAHAAIRAHKEALANAGLIIVPREPSEVMLNAKTTLTSSDAEVWQAMIDAALKEGGDAT